MAGTKKPDYGTPNWEMIGRWLELPPEDDGPFWALNLMKYHAVAQYAADAEGAEVSGRDADDAYTPRGPLAAVGAMITFAGDVVGQPLGAPAWDRVGVVRYPTRAAFFEMQRRDDFKDQHVHKEAGMEFTIVMATHPVTHDAASEPGGQVVITVAPTDASFDETANLPGVTPIATFSVEGVIVGDERSFDHVRFDRVADDTALAAVVARSAGAHVVVVDVTIDRLIKSVVSQ